MTLKGRGASERARAVRRARKVRPAEARKEKQQLIPATSSCSVSSTTIDDGPRLSDRDEQRARPRGSRAVDTETATL